MNQKIVDYLTKYKDQYPVEELTQQLQKSGFTEKEVQEAVIAVYPVNQTPQAVVEGEATIASPENQIQKPPQGKFAMSWSLLKSSFGLLAKDKEILLFPVVSAITSMLVFLGLFLPLALFTEIFSAFTDETGSRFAGYALIFMYYLLGTFIVAFFNSALVSCVMARLRGENPTFASGLREALSHKKEIFVWALISATVGLALRLILDTLSQRLGAVGQVITSAIVGLIGFAWGIATYFVVPIIITEKVGAKDAIRSSAALFKKTWGENLIGNIGMSLFFVLMAIPMMIISIGIFVSLNSLTGAVIAGALFIVSMLVLSVIASTINAIFRTVLYLYAKTGVAPEMFDANILKHAFHTKAASKGFLGK